MDDVAAPGPDRLGRTVPRHAGRRVRRASPRRARCATRRGRWGPRSRSTPRRSPTRGSRSSRRTGSTGCRTSGSRSSIHPQSVVHSAVLFRGRVAQGAARDAGHAPARSSTRSPTRAGAPRRRRRRTWSPRAAWTSGPPTRPASRPSGSPARPGAIGSRATAALIAADDVAVARFLAGTLDFPGIPRLLEASRGTLWCGSRPGAGRRRARRARPRGAGGVRRRREPAGNRGRPGSVGESMAILQGVITIALFIVILGGLVVIHEVGHFVTGAPLRDPRPRVRDRLPAAGEGAAREGRDALHAELAPDRRLRAPRGRGRRLRRPALVRGAAPLEEARRPARRRRR